jgi:hypothetical protein
LFVHLFLSWFLRGFCFDCSFVFWDRVSLCSPGWPRTSSFSLLRSRIAGLYLQLFSTFYLFSAFPPHTVVNHLSGVRCCMRPQGDKGQRCWSEDRL